MKEPASTSTVTVGCKLPAGIFMQAHKMEEIQEPVLGGGTRTAKRAVPVGPKVRINGNAAPQGSVSPHAVDGGYALTYHVPSETAHEWMKANRDSAMVRNGLIFVHDKPESAKSQSAEMAETLSGLERLNVSHRRDRDGNMVPADPRWPRSRNPNVSDIVTGSR